MAIANTQRSPGGLAHSRHVPACPNLATSDTWTIVHQVRGRVRLRLPLLLRDPSLADAVVRAFLGLPGVVDVRANAACCSLIVRYNPALITLEAVVARCDALPTRQPGHTHGERARRLLTPGVGLLALGVIHSARCQDDAVSLGRPTIPSLAPLDVMEVLGAVLRRDWSGLLLSIAFLLAAETLRQLMRRSSTSRNPRTTRVAADDCSVLVGAMSAARAA